MIYEIPDTDIDGARTLSTNWTFPKDENFWQNVAVDLLGHLMAHGIIFPNMKWVKKGRGLE